MHCKFMDSFQTYVMCVIVSSLQPAKNVYISKSLSLSFIMIWQKHYLALFCRTM